MTLYYFNQWLLVIQPEQAVVLRCSLWGRWGGPALVRSILLLLKTPFCSCTHAERANARCWTDTLCPCPCLQLLQELEPYMQQALDAVDVLREEDRRRLAALEDMIFGFRRARQSRPKLSRPLMRRT